MHRILPVLFSVLLITLIGCTQTTSADNSSDTQTNPEDNTIETPDETTGESTTVEPDPESVMETAAEFWTPPTDRPPRFLFIHHSTGSGFMFNGGMAEMLEDAGFEVHSRTYGDGWVGDNTNPDHFPVTFTDHFEDMISWDLDPGETYDIIAFKSCYPASNICSDEKYEQYVEYYDTIIEITRQNPGILFIPWSTPPLVPDATEPHCAERAHEWADYLTGTYQIGEYNLAVYDVFTVLAGSDPSSGDYNCLRYDYQNSPGDSHPNHDANVVVAEDFTEWLTGLF